MRWDPGARGGAGGWVEGSGAAPAPPSAPAPGPGPGPVPTPAPDLVPGPCAVPGSEPAPESGPPRRKAALITVAAVLAAAMCVAVVVVVGPRLNRDDGPATAASAAPSASADTTATTDGADPTGSESGSDGAAQARAVDALLDSSAADRQQVVDAVRAVAACGSVSDARTALDEAADSRESLVSRLDTLPVDLVDGGPDAVAELRTAWRQSAEADRAFADWAASADDCASADDVARDGSYDSGVNHSARATEAKEAFIARWNVIAGEYGLASRAETGI